MPKSATSTPAGSSRRASRRGDLDAEAVVAEEDVADARPRGRAAPARRRRPSRQRLDLVGREEEAVPGLARDAEVAARVVLEVDRQVHGALRCPRSIASTTRDPAGQREVEDVAARPRAAAARGCRAAPRRRRPSTASRRRGRSSASQPASSPRHPELADRAVQAHQLLLGEAPRCARGSRARAGRWRASRPSPRRSG